jgi:hypothetical protein
MPTTRETASALTAVFNTMHLPPNLVELLLAFTDPCRAAHEVEYAAAMESLRREARVRLLSALLHRITISHGGCPLFGSWRRAYHAMSTEQLREELDHEVAGSSRTWSLDRAPHLH